MLTILITAFLEGMSVLVVEIAGARALAPFFGTSLHVWTATITSTLLFLALGYGLGGRLCRRGPMALPVVLWVAGGWLGLYPLWRTALLVSLQGLGISLGAFLASSWLFGPPLACFGAVSPLLIKRLGDSGIEGGQAAGWLFLTNTLGGLVGGWLTALVLVPHFSLRVVLSGTGALVICLGALWAWKRGVHPLVFGLLIVAGMSANYAPQPTRFVKSGDRPEMIVTYRKQTATGLLQVVDVQGVYRALLLDGTTQGMIELASGKSQHPFSEYLAAMAHAYHPRAKRVLLLGLGCGVLAKTLHGMGKEVTAVEIEPEVYRAARKYFGLPAAVRVELQDGRTFLALDDRKYDVIVLDAFAGENSPWYLATREGLTAVRERLAPGGRLVINTITHADGTGEGLKRLEAALLEVFGEARVFLEPRFPSEGRELVNGALVAGKGLVRTTEPYPAEPSRHAAPFVGDMLASEHRPARRGARVDTDDASSLDVAEADVRLGLRTTAIADYGIELLQD
jgi:spermidine synthase